MAPAPCSSTAWAPAPRSSTPCARALAGFRIRVATTASDSIGVSIGLSRARPVSKNVDMAFADGRSELAPNWQGWVTTEWNVGSCVGDEELGGIASGNPGPTACDNLAPRTTRQ